MTKEIRAQVARFLADEYIPSTGDMVPKTAMREVYYDWCVNNELKEQSDKAFADGMISNGISSYRREGTHYWMNLRRKTVVQNPPAPSVAPDAATTLAEQLLESYAKMKAEYVEAKSLLKLFEEENYQLTSANKRLREKNAALEKQCVAAKSGRLRNALATPGD